jgi:polycomb protein EED
VIAKRLTFGRTSSQGILSVKFSPVEPHILASASGDRTVRVWNVFGGDFVGSLDLHGQSRNYPMGDADEGDACVFILAGEGPAGHRWDVVSLAFHPTQRAIVTTGQDYSVRIWALPEYPEVTDPFEIRRTPPGYRPEIIHFPLFATQRLHENPVDCIEWLVVVVAQQSRARH